MPFVPIQAQEPAGGFTPLSEDQPKRGFTPLQADPDRPSMLKSMALNNPLTAAGETALNLASQGVALPVAGIAGLATEAGNALGLTDKTGADVVHQVGEALTYQPRGEMGKAATEIATYPFQKLAEAGQWAGGKTLDATGSPTLATVVDTAINAAPMAIGPAKKAAGNIKERISGKVEIPTEGTAPVPGATNEAPAMAEAGRATESAAAREALQGGIDA